MKRLSMVMLLALCVPLLSDVSYAGYAEGTPFSAGNTNTTPAPDAYGQIVRIAGGSTCKATAAPPSHSEGDEVPLSCDLDGDLRTNSTGGGGGGTVQSLMLASGVTTNATSAAVAGITGNKTFWGEVVCSSGACAQTQAIYGDRDNDGANGVLLCTITLSGTTRTQDACAVSTAAYPYYYVVTTGTSGTSATGGVYAFY